MNVDFSVIQQSGGSGLRQTNQWAFTEPYRQMAQTGRNLQWLGATGTNLAIAETQALQKTRSKRILADFNAFEIQTANQLRETASADTFESLYNQNITGWINKTLNGDKQAGTPGLPDGVFKASVAQGLEQDRLTRLRPISNEARVRRLKGEKAGVEDTILSLQREYGATFGDRNPASELTRQGLAENIEGLIQGMADAGLIDPDDAVVKRQKNASDLQVAEAKFLQRTAPEEAIEYLLGNKSANIDERVRQNMIKSTDAILVRAAAASARQEEKDERAEKALIKADQDESYAVFISEASKGQLTAPQVALQLETHAIRGPQGTALIEFIGKHPDGISDPIAVHAIEKLLLTNPDGISIEQILAKEGLNQDDSIRLAKDKRMIDSQPKKPESVIKGEKRIGEIFKNTELDWKEEIADKKEVALQHYQKLLKEGRDPWLASVEAINLVKQATGDKHKFSSSLTGEMAHNRLLAKMKFGGKSYSEAFVKLRNAIAEAKQENNGVLLPEQSQFFNKQGVLLERIKQFASDDEIQAVKELSLPTQPRPVPQGGETRQAIKESGEQVDVSSVAPRKPPGEVEFGLRNMDIRDGGTQGADLPAPLPTPVPLETNKPSPVTVATSSRQPVNVPGARPVPQKAFDSEGDGFDKKTARELEELYPLTMPKPTRRGTSDGETVANEGAFSAWVWHAREGNWFKHGSSVDPRTGMLLKGRGHKTYHREEEASKKLGNVITKKKDGRYYSLTPEGNVWREREPKKELGEGEAWDFSEQIAGARSAIQQLREKAEEYGYDSKLIDLFELTLLDLETAADAQDKEGFDKLFKRFMKQVGVIQGND